MCYPCNRITKRGTGFVMAEFSSLLGIAPGLTAIIGSGGKTTLLFRLAQELARKGRVIVTTTTHIRQPEDFPFALRAAGQGRVCVGTPLPDGKLSAPEQSMQELASLADYVLVEADGAARHPLKVHASHEPVIPENAREVICGVGASGLYRLAQEVVHRPELFLQRTGSAVATPEAVARVLEEEHFHTQVLINQAETQPAAARELAQRLSGPVRLACVQKGEIIC